MKSGFFKLNVWDFVKGLIVAILTAVLTFLQTQLGIVPLDDQLWYKVLIAGITGMLAYLIKNLFTNNKDQFLETDKK